LDTNWNRTGKDPVKALKQAAAGPDRTGELPEGAPGWEPAYYVSPGRGSEGGARGSASPGKTRRRAILSFLAFFLGISLTVGSIGSAAGRWIWQGDTAAWQNSDWQETAAFRRQVSQYLESFLTLGAGHSLKWYDTEYGAADTYAYEWGDSWIFSSADTPVAADTASEAPAYQDPAVGNPDHYYESDKNVLYCIHRQGRPVSDLENGWYTNAEDSLLPLACKKLKTNRDYQSLPDGYNFLLVFEDGKTRIWKDNVELDVYGDGIYDEASLWYVPGYENFPAGDGVSGVEVYLAVREIPVRYMQGDYTGGASSGIPMYWLYQELQQSRAFYHTAAVVFCAGLLLLGVWIALRKERAPADKAIAALTVHIWTEVRFLAAAGLVLYLLFGNTSRWVYISNVTQLLNTSSAWPDGLEAALGLLLGLPLSNLPALLGLIWLLWLLRNDHKHHLKSERRNLWRRFSGGLRARDLKLPVQRRLYRWICIGIVLSGFPALVWLLVLTQSMGVSAYDSLFWITMVPLCLYTALLVMILRRNIAPIRDIGLLADQVEAIREGDLETPLELPLDADLRQTAEHLNDIQAGMHKALLEQTRSERMKVELISNVSHDLKTPLTSILSYAELLRQEPLEGAAADYARIIDEKAQRLKSMVQDVFEVSKAAADQLPVQLETLDFAKLLRQTLADMDEPIQKSRLTLKVDLPESPVLITADGKRLYRVFQNLIQNALQYALEGSRVYLTLTVCGGRAEAALRNTSRTELPEGVDFTARFVRGDESRTDGGSGLGLSIASSFTEACGGEFRVETVADLFTAVVRFPITPGAEPSPEAGGPA